MNAQKRNIDVWLIYRCMDCDNTCNITILSRTKPELIEKELFRKFSQNDEATALKYACDPDIIRKNNLQPDYSQLEYRMIHDQITINDIRNMDHPVEFKIETLYDLDLKLSHIIKECLHVSSNRLEKMVNAGIITTSSSVPLKKCKVRDGTVITINPHQLKAYPEETESDTAEE